MTIINIVNVSKYYCSSTLLINYPAIFEENLNTTKLKYVTGFTKTDQSVTRTKIQIKEIIIIHSCTVRPEYQLCGYRWPGLLSQMVFSNPVKSHWCITGPVGPLGSTYQNCLGARLLPMAISIYPVLCIHLCCPLRTQQHYLRPNGREGPTSACPPTSTISPPCLPPYK